MYSDNNIINSFIKVEKIREDIILFTIIEKSIFDIKSFEKVKNEVLKLTQNRDFHLITDISKHTTEVTNETRLALEDFQKSNSNYKSNSIILNSTWKSILLGTFLKMSKMSIPTKSFISKNTAIEWIDKL